MFLHLLIVTLARSARKTQTAKTNTQTNHARREEICITLQETAGRPLPSEQNGEKGVEERVKRRVKTTQRTEKQRKG